MYKVSLLTTNIAQLVPNIHLQTRAGFYPRDRESPDRQQSGPLGRKSGNHQTSRLVAIGSDLNGHTVSDKTHSQHSSTTARPPIPTDSLVEDDNYTAPPPHSPSQASASSSSSASPPPFSSLFASTESSRPELTEYPGPASLPAFAPPPPVEEPLESAPSSAVVADTKASFSDPKGDGLGKSTDDGEPPPPYTEGYSPLDSFTYTMAAAGGASSIITQVQQTGGPPINTLGGTCRSCLRSCATSQQTNLSRCIQILVVMNTSP